MKKAYSSVIEPLKTYYFPFFIILAATIYLAQRLDSFLPELVNNHLNDFLCMPLVLKTCLYGVRHVKSDDRIQLPLLLQISITVVFIVYFEVVLAGIDPRYTADPLDVLAYTAGLVFFMAIEGWER